MPNVERVHECVTGMPSPEYFSERKKDGWILVGLDWERETEESRPAPGRLHEVPYGFRIAPDCKHLETHDEEMRALMVMMEVIVRDRPLSEVAVELNARGFRTRRNALWNPVDVFNLLPRLVETGPAIFNHADWLALKQRM